MQIVPPPCSQICPRVAELERQVKELEEKLDIQKSENERLRKRLKIYENPNVPPSRRRYPSRRRSKSDGKRFPGRPRGHPGKTRPTPKPDVVKRPEWEECERCGPSLSPPQYVKHHIVEEISNPSPKTVIDFLEFEGKCEVCGTNITSRHPDCPPDGRFGKNALVQTTLMKFEERQTFQMVSETLERSYGLSITPAAVLDICRRVSDWLRPEYERIRRKIKTAEVVYSDETGEKVDGEREWLWGFTTSTETLFVIDKSRGRKVLEDVLGKNFKGTLVVDGWRSYPSFTRNLQRDWVHLLREADYCAEHEDEAIPLSKALHRLYDDLKGSLEDDPPPGERSRLAKNARKRLRYWLRKPYRTEKVQEFVEKVKNGFDYWFTFVLHLGSSQQTTGLSEL